MKTASNNNNRRAMHAIRAALYAASIVFGAAFVLIYIAIVWHGVYGHLFGIQTLPEFIEYVCIGSMLISGVSLYMAGRSAID